MFYGRKSSSVSSVIRVIMVIMFIPIQGATVSKKYGLLVVGMFKFSFLFIVNKKVLRRIFSRKRDDMIEAEWETS